MAKSPEKQRTGFISPQDVADTGRAAFGQQWQPQMARALRLSDQAIRRWTNDGCPVDMLSALRGLLHGRAMEISKAEQELEKYDG
jgi:hypothetical protein